MKAVTLQWLVPAIVAFALLAAHFGYNEIRVQEHARDIAELKADVRELDKAQDGLQSDVLTRLTRIETRQEIILESLGRIAQ